MTVCSLSEGACSPPLPLGRFFKNLQLGLKRKIWLATSLQYTVTL